MGRLDVTYGVVFKRAARPYDQDPVCAHSARVPRQLLQPEGIAMRVTRLATTVASAVAPFGLSLLLAGPVMAQ